MDRRVKHQANAYLRVKKGRKVWHKFASVMASVVVFCTVYAMILPAITLSANPICGLEEHTHTMECYRQDRQLVCGLEESETHAHSDECYAAVSTLICPLPEHQHTQECYEQKASSEDVTNPATDPTEATVPNTAEPDGQNGGNETTAPTQPPEQTQGAQTTEPSAETTGPSEATEATDPVTSGGYRYEDDTLAVTVELPADSTVPSDAVLRVTPITETDEGYAELTQQAEEAVSGTPEQIVLYDVSFYVSGENGEEYLSVSDQATVTFQFKEAVLAETAGEISVLHYDEMQDTPVAVETVEVQQDENNALTDLTFQTEGFSVFAVVKVTSSDDRERVTFTSDTVLDGKSYWLISYTYNRSMSATETSGNAAGTENGIKKLNTGGSSGDWSSIPLWTFTKEGDTYLISSGGNYLTMANNGDMGLTAVASDATRFTVTADNGMALISYNGKYINNWSGDSGADYFRGYGTADNGSHLRLYQKSAANVTNLDGQTFAIVNRASGNYAVTATTFPSADWPLLNIDGLAAQEVSLTTSSDGVTHVSGSNITKWTFHAVEGEPGVYTISTDANGPTQYLRFLENFYGSMTDRGSLTLDSAENATKVTIETSAEGWVYIKGEAGGILNRAGEGTGFWAADASNTATNSRMYLAKVVTEGNSNLIYDLNLPSLASTTGGLKSWATEPSLDQVIQDVTAAGEILFAKPNGSYADGFTSKVYAEKHPGIANADNPYYELYRMTVIPAGNLVNGGKLPGEDTLPDDRYYEEYAFLGWTYTDAANKVYRFYPQTVIDSIAADGSFQLKDKSGNTVTIPGGATLQGEWIQVSAPVYFFINYTGTILDTEGDVAGRNEGAFLNGTAIGRIFFAVQTVGADGTYALDVHEHIGSMFRSKENLDLELPSDGTTLPTQILIQTATTASGENLLNNPDYGEANARIILDASLSWIQAENKTVLISTGNGQTAANIDQLNADNYSIRWYVAKEQADAWHIDGVLTAVTKPLVVQKTFSGLTEEQIASLLGSPDNPGTYSIDLQIRNSTEGQTYMSLNAWDTYDVGGGITKSGRAGQYTFDGYDETTKTATWSVRLLAGEHVTLTEKGYDVSGYIPTAYSVIDGNGGSIHTGVKTGYDVAQEETNNIYDVVGGVNGEVAFSNTYTEIGKGTLSLLKKNAATGTVMQNVTFTLKRTGTDETLTVTTDSNGRADFSNLQPNTTYVLTETTPVGFLPNTKVITVSVSGPDPDTVEVSVTVTETDPVSGAVNVYSGNTSLLYVIENEPAQGTLIVGKTFRDITPDEVEALTNYQIALTSSLSGGTNQTLTFGNANYKSGDGLRYNWVITGVKDETITVTESGFGSDSYIDTAVTARVTVGDTVTEPEPVVTSVTTGEGGSEVTIKTAKVTIDADQNKTNRVELTNTYTNEFVLYLQKKDSITDQPLQGAVFKLYGSYEEATNAKDTIRYRAEDDTIKTLYYIGDTEVSDENGLAAVRNLKLSTTGKTYAYILSEYIAPDGYAKPSYPDGIVSSDQVITVTVENITNNVFSTKMVNQTIGAPLIVEKKVPENDLAVGATYTVRITISANKESIRKTNRVYSYVVYNADGTEAQSVQNVSGSQALETMNLDICSFDVVLQAGQYVLVKDVPVGYQYSVQEIIPSDAGYDCSIVNKNGTGEYNNYNCTANGTVLEVPAEITNTSDPDYAANVEARKLNTVTVNNYAIANVEDAKTQVTVNKLWRMADHEYGDSSGLNAVMKLYRVTNGDLSKAVQVGSGVTLNSGTGWSYTWLDLPLYNANGSEAYDYYLAEVPVDGFAQSYSFPTVTLTAVNGEGNVIGTVQAALVTTATITVTNTSGYELPASGGLGTIHYTFGGLLLMAAALMYGYARRRRERRARH